MSPQPLPRAPGVTQRTTAGAALAFVLAIAGGAGGCWSGLDARGLDAHGPIALAETVPGLLESAGAVVFTYSARHDCRTLVDASATELDDLIAAEGDPPLQRIPMLRGAVDNDRNGAFEDGAAQHTFADVPANAPVSFLALAVARDPGRVFRLRDLGGTIFAVGCRTLTPTSNTNVGLPLVLAPAGLR